MSSDPLHAVEGVADRVRALSRRSTQLVTLRDRLASELSQKEAEVQELGFQIERLTKVSELFRKLMDLLVDKQVRAVENIVTEGLKSIFDNLDLSFEADVGPKYNKIAVEFFLRSGAKDSPVSHRGPPLEAFGGGPSSVASLILRILTVLRLKRYPILFLDEALAAVSAEYVDAAGRFLTSLSERLKVVILLVTHQQGFLDHAVRAYRCTEDAGDDGTTWLSLKDLK